MTKKYYKYVDNYGPPNGSVYLEAINGWTLRQIMVGTDEIIASNVNHPQWGLVLTDQQVDYDSVEEVQPIAKEEFEQVWTHHLRQHRATWEETKSRYPEGSSVHGSIEIVYPEGIIVKLSDGALGIANYAACEKTLGVQNVSKGQPLTVVVTGHDDLQQWVTLGTPQSREDDVT